MAKILKHAYAGGPHVRQINASDFKKVGIEDQSKVVWSPDNHHTAELSEEAAQWLLENEPGDWELVESSQFVEGSSSSSAESGEDDEEIAGSPTASRTARRRPNVS